MFAPQGEGLTVEGLHAPAPSLETRKARACHHVHRRSHPASGPRCAACRRGAGGREGRPHRYAPPGLASRPVCRTVQAGTPRAWLCIKQALVTEFAERSSLTENHTLLAALPISASWTTNYDELIEYALRAARERPDVKCARVTRSAMLRLTNQGGR